MKTKLLRTCALAIALVALCSQSQAAQQKCWQRVVAIPETNFSDPSVLSLFGSYQTDGYPAKQITLKGGNGVADFVQSPAFYMDAQQQPTHSSQILADGSTSYTKVIPFQKPFHIHFQVTMVNPVPPAFGPFGGTVFELHDTDPVFAQYGDPSISAIRLVNENGNYVFYANDKAVWTAPYTLKSGDRFDLIGVLQENNSTVNDGRLELKRNGVVVAKVTGANTHSMTPVYPPIIGSPGGNSGPPPHPLTAGPHVRLGLGKVPPPTSPNQPRVTTEDYIDNVGAVYWQ